MGRKCVLINRNINIIFIIITTISTTPYSVCVMSAIFALDSVYGRTGGQYVFRTPPAVQPIRLWNLHPRQFGERVYRGSVQLWRSAWGFWKYSRHSWVIRFLYNQHILSPNLCHQLCDSLQKHTYVINVQAIMFTCWIGKLVCRVELHIIVSCVMSWCTAVDNKLSLGVWHFVCFQQDAFWKKYTEGKSATCVRTGFMTYLSLAVYFAYCLYYSSFSVLQNNLGFIMMLPQETFFRMYFTTPVPQKSWDAV